MGLKIFLICFVILAIVILIILSVVSPDNWGRASDGCNQNCCVSCSNSCANSSGFGATSGGNKSKAFYSLNEKNLRVFNEKGEEATQEFITKHRQDVLRNLQLTYDPYTSDMNADIWKSFIQAKIDAEKNVFINQPIYVIKSRWFKPFSYHNIKKKN